MLSWRNHPAVKQWMLTQHDITLQEHLHFIQSLKHASGKDYFLVKDKDDYMGVIDLTGNTLGLYANPKRQRMGDALLQELIDYAFTTKHLPSILAEVYKENTKAIRLYERFGFCITQEKPSMYTMELKNENRQF